MNITKLLALFATIVVTKAICSHSGCLGVETAASMLFESVLEYGVSNGSGGLRNTRITQRRCNGLS